MSEKNLRNVVAENPLLILFLGACPAMGATATVLGAAGMGAAVLVVMLLSGIVMAALNKVIPASGRVPAYILIITGFVSIVQMLLNAFLPDVYKMMGIYITVAAVDLLIFGTGESAENGMGAVISASVKNGLRFLAVLVVMGVIREALGSASIAGKELAFLANYRIPALTMAPGGFIVYSFVAAIISKLSPAGKMVGEGAACAAAGLCSCEKNEEVA